MNPESVRLELIKALLQYRPDMFVEDIGAAVSKMEAAVYVAPAPQPSSKAPEMPRYLCHKKVWALKIAAIEINADNSATIASADESYAPFTTKAGWADRFKGSGEDKGYYVVYDDDFASWSPSKAFKDGYSKL